MSGVFRRTATRWLVALSLVCTAGCRLTPEDTAGPRPSPDLTPQQVVEIQVEALAHYHEPRPNAGIWTAFQFASPANRRITGPYGRFMQVIKAPENRPFLVAASYRVKLLDLDEDASRAHVLAELTAPDGSSSAWVFTLRRQTEGEYLGSWMTDGVTRRE